jgi:glycosyltransferase involved in cell wall biosynthesis
MIAGEDNIDISIVVPVYKEEANIRPFLQRMEPVLASITERYEILFCLDPSPDRTEEVIQGEIARNPRVKLVVFSRRFGQPAATLGGIALSKGKACIVIDVDLQDPPELIPEMHAKMKDGFDVVYAKRRSSKSETLTKRLISWVGYGVINRLSDVRIPRNTGDFRVMSRRVCNELTRLNEGHGFLRGLVAFVGFPQTFVEYNRDPRHTGTGHYNRFTGSIRIGLNGIISFGSRPLQLMSIVGFLVAGFSFLVGGYYVIGKLLGVNYNPGLPTTVLVVTFFSGVQLLSLGLMGEYIGRIYDEVKQRPKYIIHKQINLSAAEPVPIEHSAGSGAEHGPAPVRRSQDAAERDPAGLGGAAQVRSPDHG